VKPTKTTTETLTRIEEMITRMRHGISVPATEELSFRGQHHPATREKLAEMERHYLRKLGWVSNEQSDVEAGPDFPDRKQRILDKLRNL